MHMLSLNEIMEQINTLHTIADAHNLQRATGARPVPPVQPHDC